MLTYHPAFDIYNCAFRILVLTDDSFRSVNEVDRVRIWDFYLTFPQQAQKIEFPRDLWTIKNSFKIEPNIYEDIIDPILIFERMRPYQMSAIRYLFATGFFEAETIKDSKLVRTKKQVPSELQEKMINLSEKQRYVLRLIQSPLNELTLYGPKGLKERTGLMEYKYDGS